MGSWITSGLTGYGHAGTGNGGAQYNDVLVTVTNFGPGARQIGAGPLYPVKYVGSYAIGCNVDDSWGCDPALASMWEPIHFLSQDFEVFPRWGQIIAPTFFWMLQPGVEIHVEVYW